MNKKMKYYNVNIGKASVERVEADSVKQENGCLLFFAEGELKTAFSKDGWRSFWPINPPRRPINEADE